MKYFKNIKASFKLVLSLFLLLIVSGSCTKKMEDINYNQKLISDKMLEADANEGSFALPGMQLNILSVMETAIYELENVIAADSWGGYGQIGVFALNNAHNHTYAMIDGWDNFIYNLPAGNVLDPWVAMKKKGFDTKYPDLFAMATIFKTFAGQRLIDAFGPLPYSLYGTASEVAFDSEEEAYSTFFTDLATSVDALKAMEADNPTADLVRYAKVDKSMYGGDYAKWIKVANTLRLRAAMRIVYVDATKAQNEAEAAVNDEYGVLTSAEGSFEMPSGTVHPLQTITEIWGESRVNASVESFLYGYSDPRLPVYAKPSVIIPDSVKGIRSGAFMDIAIPSKYSQFNFVGNDKVKLMDVAESYFLKAEGALRGWNMGGTPQEFYEAGIRASFTSNKVGGIEAYLGNDTGKPKYYVDPMDPRNNAAPLTTITVKWDESATFEQKLERIITQKWIAMFPEGYEAWSEFRRTGYPRLWPIPDNRSAGVLADGEFIKRIPYPPGVKSASQAACDAAINAYLDGKDDIAQRIWWDVE